MGGTSLKISGLLLSTPELPQLQHPEGLLSSLCSWISGNCPHQFIRVPTVVSLDLSQLEWVSAFCNLSRVHCLLPLGCFLRRITRLFFLMFYPARVPGPSPT